MDRNRIYEIINSERNYQQDRYGKDQKLSIKQYLLLIQEYLTKANSLWYLSDTEVMDCLREIAALCVSCGEEHGMRERKGYANDRLERKSTPIPWKRINSSSISHLRYNPVFNELDIRFTSGGEYKYYDIEPHVYRNFIEARSKGQFYHRNIAGIYYCTKTI
jgi:hypothetical protein